MASLEDLLPLTWPIPFRGLCVVWKDKKISKGLVGRKTLPITGSEKKPTGWPEKARRTLRLAKGEEVASSARGRKEGTLD